MVKFNSIEKKQLSLTKKKILIIPQVVFDIRREKIYL